MEIGLNLLWLGIALVFMSAWLFRWRSVSRRRAFSEAVALGCALILLFPSVSLTDDLHPQIIALDSAAGKRSICQPLGGGHRNVSRGSISGLQLHGHAFVAVLPNLPVPGALASQASVAEASSLYGEAFRTSFSGRSPPALPLS